MDRDEGGYAWHPGPNFSAGLCQGLASRNVSGGIVELLDLREAGALSPLPQRVFITHRDPPWEPTQPFAFSGSPLTPGNTFFIAGTFADSHSVAWETAPFSAAGQRFADFGFVAVTRHERRAVFTPLRFAENEEAPGRRTEAKMVLRSTEAIEVAAVTLTPLDGDLIADEDQERTLDHDQRGARTLLVTLPPDVPDLFVVSVTLCTAADASTCELTEDSPATAVFRVVWPASP